MSFYEKGPVRIQYEEVGSGFPLLLVPGGGLNSTIAGLKRGGPFNAIEEFKGEYRCTERIGSVLYFIALAAYVSANDTTSTVGICWSPLSRDIARRSSGENILG